MTLRHIQPSLAKVLTYAMSSSHTRHSTFSLHIAATCRLDVPSSGSDASGTGQVESR